MQLDENEALRDIDELLVQWGRWSKQRLGLKLGYPGAANFAKFQPHSGAVCALTDTEGERLDEAVSRLRAAGLEDWHELAQCHYILGWPLKRIAKKIGKGETIARMYKRSILAFVAGIIYAN